MDNDDRKPLMQLYKEYEKTGRVILFEDHNCVELKGIISKCRFFVGARTHSTIAAYSMGIPTLVVGYSVKARGIARDLFSTEKNYVLPVQELWREESLLEAFKLILNNEKTIKLCLKDNIPVFRKKISSGIEIIKNYNMELMN